LIKDDHPAAIIGSWISVNSAGSKIDTVYVFASNGTYKYSISVKTDSVTRDTSYLDAGVWEIHYSDDNGNSIYNAPEQALFYSYSTFPGHEVKKDYLYFTISIVNSTDIFELYAKDGSPLFTLQREGN
jgi:hypothetical protein